MNLPFGRPILGEDERSAVLEVLESPQLVHGPAALAFERTFAKFIGGDVSASSVSSATSGLYLAYAALGVGPGTEVVVPALTHVATAHAAHALGATVRFADVDPESGNVTAQLIAEAVTPQTKVICVVHYLGLPVDMSGILALARANRIGVVEDCALALGTRLHGQHAGTLGDIGVFSFYPAKHMTTGEGGMVVSTNEEVIDRVRSMKAFGYDKSLSERTVPGVYDIKEFGLNLRMSEVAAALGTVQLQRVPEFAHRRAANSERLRSNLARFDGLTMQRDPYPGEDHAHYCEVVKFDGITLETRNRLALAMQSRGIGTSVYYPVPLPDSRFYSGLPGAQQLNFSGAAGFSHRSLALPIGPHLEPADMDTIAQGLVESWAEASTDD